MDKVDTQEIGLSVAYQLAALAKDEQALLLDAMAYSQNTPSLSQAQRLRKASKEGTLTRETMREMLSEEKKTEAEKLTFMTDNDPQYFPALLHAQTDAGDHHQAAGGMAEKAPTQPRSLITYDKLPTHLRSGFFVPKIRRSLCLSAHFAIDQSTLPATFAQNTSRNRGVRFLSVPGWLSGLRPEWWGIRRR